MTDTLSSTPLLIVGSFATARESAYTLLQKNLCISKACNICLTCTQIRANQHARIVWFAPTKQYTIEEIDELRRVTSFQRSKEDPLYIVLERMDSVSETVANSLLKLLEEPPTHHYFILLAMRQQQVLATIRSRCHLIQCDTTYTIHSSIELLYSLFTQLTFPDASITMQAIDKTAATEQDTVGLLDLLAQYWSSKYHHAIITNNSLISKQAEYAMKVISQHSLQPPMPGSTKLFLRNLYLQLFFNHP